MKICFLVLIVMLMAVGACASQPTLAPTPVPPTSAPTSSFVSPTPAHALEVTKDVEYTTPLQPDVPAQALDVYRPADPGPWPVVVLLPGFASGRNSLPYTSLAKELAGRGVVVLLPNWRWSSSLDAAKNDGRILREASEELACALAFSRDRAADYGGDPGWITLFGHAAGAGVEITTALVGDDAEAWEAFAARRGGPPPLAACQVTGVPAQADAWVEYGGHYQDLEYLKDSDPELWALASPFARIGQNPALRVSLVHGEQDQVVSLQKAVAFHEALVDAGYAATLTVVQAEHQLPWSGLAREEIIQAILAAAYP